MKSSPASSQMCDIYMNATTMSARISETEYVGQLKPVASHREVNETQYCVFAVHYMDALELLTQRCMLC